MGVYDNIEIGNLLFGHSRGSYAFPDRDIVDSDEWLALLCALGTDFYGYVVWDDPHETKRGGYDDGTICINPYYWGDDDDEAAKPNFLDRSIGLEIRWYKYPFRDAYMNWKMSAEEVKKYFGGLAIKYMAKRYSEGVDAVVEYIKSTWGAEERNKAWTSKA